jgi:hypothetical protein
VVLVGGKGVRERLKEGEREEECGMEGENEVCMEMDQGEVMI